MLAWSVSMRHRLSVKMENDICMHAVFLYFVPRNFYVLVHIV